jgi:hypothetical protein
MFAEFTTRIDSSVKNWHWTETTALTALNQGKEFRNQLKHPSTALVEALSHLTSSLTVHYAEVVHISGHHDPKALEKLISVFKVVWETGELRVSQAVLKRLLEYQRKPYDFDKTHIPLIPRLRTLLAEMSLPPTSELFCSAVQSIAAVWASEAWDTLDAPKPDDDTKIQDGLK